MRSKRDGKFGWIHKRVQGGHYILEDEKGVLLAKHYKEDDLEPVVFNGTQASFLGGRPGAR